MSEMIGEPMPGRQLPLDRSMLVRCGVCDRYHDDTRAQPPYDRDGRIRYSSEEAGHEWVGTAHVALFSKEDEAEAIRQGFEIGPR